MSEDYELRIAGTWDGSAIAESEQVIFEISAEDDGWRIGVDAPFHGDPAPPGKPGPTDGLWDYEVAELFIVGRDHGSEPLYIELELSPHGHYLLLRLHGVRQAVESLELQSYTARIDGGRWRGEALLDRRLLPLPPHRANAYGIHGMGDARRYLAMTPVPGPAPDFHRLETFEPIERWRRR